MSTRNRPQECAELVAAFKATGDVPPVAVMIDDDPAKYADVPWPAHWDIHVAPEHLEMARAHNTLLAMYPGHRCYGFFGDHFRPTQPVFRELEAAAGDWFMSWLTDKEGGCWTEMSGAPTFGGKLIAELGWINLPTLFHVATECPFTLLWRHIGNVRVLDLHFDRTWPVGQGAVTRMFNGYEVNDHDGRAYFHWMQHEAPEVLRRVRGAMMNDGIEFTDNGVIHPKYGCHRFGHNPSKGG